MKYININTLKKYVILTFLGLLLFSQQAYAEDLKILQVATTMPQPPRDGSVDFNLTAKVTGNVNSVTVNLSSIGGNYAEAMYDDGNHNDGAANDGLYGVTGVVAIAPGADGTTRYDLTVTAIGPNGSDQRNIYVYPYDPSGPPPTPPKDHEILPSTGTKFFSPGNSLIINFEIINTGAATTTFYTLPNTTGPKLTSTDTHGWHVTIEEDGGNLLQDQGSFWLVMDSGFEGSAYYPLKLNLNLSSAKLGETDTVTLIVSDDEDNSKTVVYNIEIVSRPQIINWYNNKTKDNSTSVTINESEGIYFNATADQEVNWNWYKDGVNQNHNYDNFTTSWSSSGTYTVSVNATNSNGTSNTVTWEIEVEVIEGKKPSIPTGLIAIEWDREVELAWLANSEPNIAGYNVYRSTTSGSGYLKINTNTVTQTRYYDTGLTNGQTYYYVITALDKASNESSYSSEVSATPQVLNYSDDGNPNYVRGTVNLSDGVTPAPNTTMVTVKVTSGSNSGFVNVTYVDESADIPPFLKGKGYYQAKQVYFSTGDTFMVRAENSTHYGEVTGLSFVTGGNGGFGTGEVDLRINKTKAVDPTNLTSILNSNDTVTVTWNGSVEGLYDIYVTENYGEWNGIYATVQGLSWTDRNAANYSRRYYKVGASGKNWTNETVGKFEIKLYKGMNLISLPLLPSDNSFDGVILQNSTNYSVIQVMRRNNENGEYDIIDWYPDMNKPYGLWYDATVYPKEPSFEPDVAYWFKTIQSFNLTLTGAVPVRDRNVTLYAGMNLVGWTSVNTMNFSNAILQNSTNYSVIQVMRRNNENGEYDIIDWYPDQNYPYGLWYDATVYPKEPKFRPSIGYWLKLNKDWNWKYST